MADRRQREFHVQFNPHGGNQRVGLIVPALNDLIEPECVWMAPQGISFHSTRVYMKETTADDLRGMNSELKNAARLLASVKPHVAAYACTAASFLDGQDALARLEEVIREELDCPVVITSAAMVDALRSLGVKRVALATPYPADVTEAEGRFFTQAGFAVVSSTCLGYSGYRIVEVRHPEIMELARRADHPDAEAIFISCTGLRALETVGDLEKELGKPVLTSNQVTFWGIMKALGQRVSLSGFGTLLS
ncbi:maleate cis-trans isomerase family protein (plasmid) [Mesorhizobium sp. ORM8.1]